MALEASRRGITEMGLVLALALGAYILFSHAGWDSVDVDTSMPQECRSSCQSTQLHL